MRAGERREAPRGRRRRKKHFLLETVGDGEIGRKYNLHMANISYLGQLEFGHPKKATTKRHVPKCH